jgi:hypothetical protein
VINVAEKTPTYDVNYDDDRFQQVETDKQAALGDVDNTYSGIIGNADKYFQDQIDAAQEWADTQSQLQQEKTDFTIQQIEQQKDQAHKDYLKEQSGAYVDWQKQSNAYGANAEKMASSGLTGTGFSESSQVSMYNAYQNRVATARASFDQAVLSYNNAMTEARLQNNTVLAEIAYEALQQQLELSLQGFQYKNSLILEQASKKLEVENLYYQRWQDVLTQINTENALAEDARRFNENLAFQEKENQLDRQFQAKEADIDRKFEEKMAGINQQYKLAYLEAETKAERELLDKKHKQDLEKLEKQHEYDKKMLTEELAKQKELIKYQNSLSNGGNVTIDKNGGGGSGNDSDATIDKKNQVSTPYYQGSLNPDAKKYGTFANGYQPKGISGHGALTKSGSTIVVETKIMYGDNKGQAQKLQQTVWKAADGSLWYWEGRQNKYIRINTAAVGSGGGGRKITAVAFK